ncbi:Protein fmp52, mitochondrial [Tulasnella sp. 424]|nr:Protein fmp52, mitochondrial [Tulasnella sp. 424]
MDADYVPTQTIQVIYPKHGHDTPLTFQLSPSVLELLDAPPDSPEYPTILSSCGVSARRMVYINETNEGLVLLGLFVPLGVDAEEKVASLYDRCVVWWRLPNSVQDLARFISFDESTGMTIVAMGSGRVWIADLGTLSNLASLDEPLGELDFNHPPHPDPAWPLIHPLPWPSNPGKADRRRLEWEKLPQLSRAVEQYFPGKNDAACFGGATWFLNEALHIPGHATVILFGNPDPDDIPYTSVEVVDSGGRIVVILRHCDVEFYGVCLIDQSVPIETVTTHIARCRRLEELPGSEIRVDGTAITSNDIAQLQELLYAFDCFFTTRHLAQAIISNPEIRYQEPRRSSFLTIKPFQRVGAGPQASESVLLLGATGATGKNVLRDLLASNHFSRVVEAGRRITPADSLQDAAGKEKLTQKTIDFEKLEESGLKDEKVDVVVIVLGTSKAQAGSAEAFEKIDREYVLNAAKAAKTDSPKQRVVYLSSVGANAKSPFLYARLSKGLTEQGLAALYNDCIVFRPGLLKDAERPEPSLVENVYGKVLDILPFGKETLAIPARLSLVIKQVSKAITLAAVQGSANLAPEALATKEDPQKEGVPPYWVITNKGGLGLSRLWK